MSPIRVDQLLAATSGWAIGVPAGLVDVERIVIDSRDVRPGDLFWALKGHRHDGHEYIEQAARNGAVACVVELSRVHSHTVPLIAVENSLTALQNVAQWYREQQEALVIGVTGSVGKSTTRHMIHSVLGQEYRGIESPHNFNNHIGVPLTLLSIESDHEFAVVELGASHLGEIRDLCDIAQPEVGVVTRIAPAHLKQFGDLQRICQAKGELLEALPRSGFAVINGDDPLVRELAQRATCRTIFVGERPGNDVVATNVRGENGLLRFRVDGTEFTVTAVGRHHLIAALTAIAIAREVEVEDVEIADALSRFEPLNGRCTSRPVGDWTVIDDSYNASPESMRAACEVLRDWQQCHQRVLIAGDMLELGKESHAFHSEFGRQIAQAGIQRVLCIGEHAAVVAAAARQAGMDPGRIGLPGDAATEQLLLDLWLEPRDVILIKGSRALGMERFVQKLQQLSHERATDVPSALRDAA